MAFWPAMELSRKVVTGRFFPGVRPGAPLRADRDGRRPGALCRPVLRRAGGPRGDCPRLRRPVRPRMTWHYAAGGERHGPVDDAELDRLIAAGTVTGDTPSGTPAWTAGGRCATRGGQARGSPRPSGEPARDRASGHPRARPRPDAGRRVHAGSVTAGLAPLSVISARDGAGGGAARADDRRQRADHGDDDRRRGSSRASAAWCRSPSSARSSRRGTATS